MKIKLILIIFISILLISCAKKASDVECLYDTDCSKAGCSGELCVAKTKASEIVTSCIYKPEYDCLQKTACECVDYKCRWAENEEYLGCMEDLSQ